MNQGFGSGPHAYNEFRGEAPLTFAFNTGR